MGLFSVFHKLYTWVVDSDKNCNQTVTRNFIQKARFHTSKDGRYGGLGEISYTKAQLSRFELAAKIWVFSASGKQQT
jgi:uncharacterized protein with FMN-binding domain